MPAPSVAIGYIVLAAYRPDPELFTRQLRSIQSQTVSAFRCLITADGDSDDVAELVQNATAGDERFQVLGYEDRLGFYGNFERGLGAVPEEAAWIALSDQDDAWYPEKLAVLLPHLRDVQLVSGQARVVRYPSGDVVASSTERRELVLPDVLVENQFTGGQLVFRRSVLDVALPFPRLATPAEVHDHWLAVVADVLGGTRIVPNIVQDYTQHDGNVIGESTAGFRPLESMRNAKKVATRFEQDGGARSLAKATYKVSAGWIEQMLRTLQQRLPANPRVAKALELYGPKPRRLRALRRVVGSTAAGRISLRATVTYLAGRFLALIPGVADRG